MSKIFVSLLATLLSISLYSPESQAMIKGDFSINASHLIDDDFDNTGLALSADIGLDVLPNISVLALATAHLGREDFGFAGETTLLNFFAGPVIEFFPGDRVFFRGGGGYVYTQANHSVDIAGSSLNFDYDRSGFGLYSGVGLVLLDLGITNLHLNINYIPQWFDGGERDSFVHWVYGGLGLGF